MQSDTIRLIIIAAFPGLVLALALYFTDRYNREPFGLLLKIFLFGMLAAIPTIFIERILSELSIFFAGIFKIVWTAFIVAGFTEEFFKRLVVLRVAYFHPAFDEKLDGIIYAAFSALGFATVENIMYVISGFSANPYIWIYRGILSVPAHMLFAITMGYYISLAKFCPYEALSRYFMKRSLIDPIILHGIFDFILMTKIPLLMVLFIPFVIYLWVINIKKLNIYYQESKMHNKL